MVKMQTTASAGRVLPLHASKYAVLGQGELLIQPDLLDLKL